MGADEEAVMTARTHRSWVRLAALGTADLFQGRPAGPLDAAGYLRTSLADPADDPAVTMSEPSGVTDLFERTAVLPSDFACSVVFFPDRTVLTVRGELDILSASGFGDFIDAAALRPGNPIVVDFAELYFIDASGLGQLARALASLRERGGDLAIASASPMAYKVLEVTGFTDVLTVERRIPAEA